MKALGIDLAGKDENPTGLSVLGDNIINSDIVHTDGEIVNSCESEDPHVVAIDAPLSLPKNRGLRECDTKLVERGYRVLPPLLGGMEALTHRGIKLARVLQDKKFEVIEVHPLTSGKILFETSSRKEWISELSRENWEVDLEMNEHEIDSAIAAFTGYLHLKGKTKRVGGEEGSIVIPRDSLTSF